MTCSSARPRYSSPPSASHRARSPVRYSRAPGSPPNGSGTNRSAVSSGRPRYPRASCAPPRYSSPGTPTGAGAPPRSSTYARTFATGRPIGRVARVSSPVGTCHVASMHASVGPYRFTTSAPVSARARAAAPAGNASPPQKIRRTPRSSPNPGSSSSTCSCVGTNCTTVTPSAAIVRTSCAGSRCAPGAASTSSAPDSSGAHSSHTEASKLKEVFWSTRSPAPSGNSSPIHAMWLDSAPCGTATPFGLPVDPEV